MMTKRTPVLWFTGLPCSGKTTLAHELKSYFDSVGLKSVLLDGDEIRQKVSNENFSTESRNLHINYIGYLASKFEELGIIPIVALISPNSSSRTLARSLCHNFVEIYLNPPSETCESRDVKGHYKKARAGELKNFTGVSSVYEIPNTPEIIIDTEELDIQSSAFKIINHLKDQNFIK